MTTVKTTLMPLLGLFLLTMTACLGVPDGEAEPVPALPAVEPDLWFPVGEKLTYRVYWGIIPVGLSEATTQWKEYNGRKVLSIRFRSKTNRFLSKLYPVDDIIESLIDPGPFLPVYFTKNLKEGRYRAHEETFFDYEKGEANMRSLIKDRKKAYAIDEDTRDLVSLMYYLRGQAANFEIGTTENFVVMADEELYDLVVRPLKNEMVKLPGFGKVESTRFEPQAKFQGLFVRKGKMWVWVSNDERRIVTKVQAKIPVASVKILLAKVEGPGDDRWIEQSKDIEVTLEPKAKQPKKHKRRKRR